MCRIKLNVAFASILFTFFCFSSSSPVFRVLFFFRSFLEHKLCSRIYGIYGSLWSYRFYLSVFSVVYCWCCWCCTIFVYDYVRIEGGLDDTNKVRDEETATRKEKKIKKMSKDNENLSRTNKFFFRITRQDTQFQLIDRNFFYLSKIIKIGGKKTSEENF